MATCRKQVQDWIQGDFNRRDSIGIILPMLMCRDEATAMDDFFETWLETTYISDLNGKANSIHTHVISDVSGLQTLLNGIYNELDNITISDVAGLQTALNGKANTVHSHVISDITGLQTALDAKASTSAITGLQTQIDAKISKSPKAAAIATITTTPTADAITILGISVPTFNSYQNLVTAHNALKTSHNTLLAANRSRDIIDP